MLPPGVYTARVIAVDRIDKGAAVVSIDINAKATVTKKSYPTRDGFRVYVEEPPSHFKPRSSYTPKIGEWFWWQCKSRDKWTLRYRKSEKEACPRDGNTYRETRIGVFDGSTYKGKCLPAQDPNLTKPKMYGLPSGSKVARFKDPPSEHIKPDPDYVPEVGEFFWVKRSEFASWELRQLQGHGVCYKSYEVWKLCCWSLDMYKGLCLPAEPPEELPF